MIIRILILSLLIWIILRYVKKYIKNQNITRNKRNSFTKTNKCVICGTYIAENKTVFRNGKSYCSSRHRDTDTRHNS